MKWTIDDLSRGAALLASIAGVITLAQFNRGLDFEKDKLAVEMFRDYLQDKREFDRIAGPAVVETRAFATNVQASAETIYRFRSEAPGWEATVMGMIKDNEAALLSVKSWRCQAMDRKYYCAVQKELGGRLDCDQPPTCP